MLVYERPLDLQCGDIKLFAVDAPRQTTLADKVK